MNLWPFIEVEEAEQHRVKRACELLEVSRAGYYTQRKHIPSRRGLDDAELTTRIKTIHADSKGTDGAPRIHARLRRDGIHCGKKRVARLLVQAGLAGRCPRSWRRTTIADPNSEARAVDLIRRVLGPDVALDTRWCGDVTYVPERIRNLPRPHAPCPGVGGRGSVPGAPSIGGTLRGRRRGPPSIPSASMRGDPTRKRGILTAGRRTG